MLLPIEHTILKNVQVSVEYNAKICGKGMYSFQGSSSHILPKYYIMIRQRILTAVNNPYNESVTDSVTNAKISIFEFEQNLAEW